MGPWRNPSIILQFLAAAGLNQSNHRWLIRMGIDADPRAEPELDCKEDDLLKFSGTLVINHHDPLTMPYFLGRGSIGGVSTRRFPWLVFETKKNSTLENLFQVILMENPGWQCLGWVATGGVPSPFFPPRVAELEGWFLPIVDSLKRPTHASKTAWWKHEWTWCREMQVDG